MLRLKVGWIGAGSEIRRWIIPIPLCAHFQKVEHKRPNETQRLIVFAKHLSPLLMQKTRQNAVAKINHATLMEMRKFNADQTIQTVLI